MKNLSSYVEGRWHEGQGHPATLKNPTTEEDVAQCNTDGIDFAAVLAHARSEGGPGLRALSFAQRGERLKALSAALHEAREELIDLAVQNGGNTRGDAKFDIDGATGTLAAYAGYAKGLGDRPFLPDGAGTQLSRSARFWGQHIRVPRLGAAVHINAFNFPAWGMMEKLACSVLAGVPVVEKPGTATALIAWRVAQITAESGILPAGSYQFLCGSVGDLLDHLLGLRRTRHKRPDRRDVGLARLGLEIGFQLPGERIVGNSLAGQQHRRGFDAEQFGALEIDRLSLVAGARQGQLPRTHRT